MRKTEGIVPKKAKKEIPTALRCVHCTHPEAMHFPDEGLVKSDRGSVWTVPCNGVYVSPEAEAARIQAEEDAEAARQAERARLRAEERARKQAEADVEREQQAELVRAQEEEAAILQREQQRVAKIEGERQAVEAALGDAIRARVLSTIDAVADPEQESVCGLCGEGVEDATVLLSHVMKHRAEAGV